MEPVDRRLLLAGAGLAGAAAISRLAKAGPLDPPAGPVHSTGKTLDEIYDNVSATRDKVARTPAGLAEARTPVQSLPGSPTAQFVIDQPGCYYLTGNITGEPGKSAIEIRADHVELECDGFTFIGAQGTDACIRAVPGGGAATLRCIGVYDAGFKGWQGACCDLAAAQDSCVEECWFDSCVSVAADGTAGACCTLGQGGTIYDCDSRRCAGATMSVGPHGVIEECACTDGSGGGACFTSPGDCVFEDNFAMNCDGPAFVAQHRAVVLYNRCVACAGGVDVGSASVVQENDLDVAPASGAPAIAIRGGRCCVEGNYCAGGGIVVASGGDGTLIEDNQVAGTASSAAGTGGGVIFIEQGVTRCHIASNRVRGNSVTAAFSIPPGNSYGPIAVVSDAGDLSATPSSAHPLVNLVH